MTSARARIVLGKIGLDAHDNGIQTVSKWLSDAGYEVIYLGLYNSAERIAKAAEEEDAHLVGVSFLGGEHLACTGRLIKLLESRERSAIKVVVGGVVPPEDVAALKEMGVAHFFGPGTSRADILTGIAALTG